MGYGTTGGPAYDLATLMIHLPAPNPTHTNTYTTDVSSSDNPDAPTRPISAAMSSHSASRNTIIPSQASQDIAADYPREGVIDIPSPVDPILQYTLSGGASLQPNEALATIVSPAVVAGSLSSPPLMPAPSPALVGSLHPPAESSVNKSDRIPHGPRFSSSSLSTASPRAAREGASSSDRNVTTTISRFFSLHDTQDTNISTQPELPRNPASQSYHNSDQFTTRES